MPAKLLNPKVIVRIFNDITHVDMKKLLRARTQKKFAFKDVAYDVEEVGKDRYNVRMEYIT